MTPNTPMQLTPLSSDKIRAILESRFGPIVIFAREIGDF
jgi:hypothetical protein